jgi:uncharacterized protein (DUF1501 family)
MNIDRRYFLKSSGVALASFGLMGYAPDFLRQFAQAETVTKGGKNKILIAIFQRGAVDGLNMVVPFGESEYYNVRRSLAIPKAGARGGALNLDGFFGLHPALKPLEKFYQSKQLAVIHSVGSPENTRSHFDAQDYMESGTPGVKSTKDGWLNRHLQATIGKEDSPFRAVAMSQQVPRTLIGRAPTIAMTGLADFSIRAGVYTSGLKNGFEGIYEQNAKDTLNETGKETFEAVNYLKQANPAQFKPENGAAYPATPLGSSLRQIAQLIKAGVGLEVAFAETGGWDTHANQAQPQNPSQGQLANLLRDFGAAIAALAMDLGKRMDDVVIVTMSEFGRRVRQNGTGGTDHGHGNAMFVLGNAVKGGKVYADWKGLKNDQLFEGMDLAVTTDYRDILAEIAQKHLGNKNTDKLFPGFAISQKNFKGILG